MSSHSAKDHDEHTDHDNAHKDEARARPHHPMTFFVMCVLGGMVFVYGMFYLLPLIWLGLVLIGLGFVFFYF